MGKWAPDAGMDAALSYYSDATVLHVCSAQPANYAGIAAVSLASVVVDAGDFAIGDGAVDGRKLTTAAQNGVTVTNSGTASHVVLAKVSDTTLRLITTCTAQALTAANQVNVPAWTWTIRDPS